MSKSGPNKTINPNYTSGNRQLLLNYTLQLADTSFILSHRLSEWCGHGPVLEQDMAVSNIALDLLGEARSLYQYAAELEGKKQTEDDLAFLRSVREYKNPLLVEQPNGDFADTIIRQFLFDVFHYLLLQHLKSGKDERLAAIAEKSFKEVSYHIKWSSEWVIRLGDGTEESGRRIKKAVLNLWRYSGELYTMTTTEELLANQNFIPNYSILKKEAGKKIAAVFEEANLTTPENVWMQTGGKDGFHSEHLGYILTEIQYMQRTYPGLKW